MPNLISPLGQVALVASGEDCAEPPQAVSARTVARASAEPVRSVVFMGILMRRGLRGENGYQR
ncbi:hypothetical protein D3C73_1652640 [compost metagenome]